MIYTLPRPGAKYRETGGIQENEDRTGCQGYSEGLD